MSLDGNTFSFIPYTLDGINDAGLSTGYVPYTGANQDTDLNSQAIRTTYTPTLTNDLTNKGYVDSAISSNTLLPLNNTWTGTNTFNNTLTANDPVSVNDTFTVANTANASLSNLVRTELNNVLAGYTPASITVGSGFGTITESGGVYESTSTGPGSYASLYLGNVVVGDKYSISLSLKSIDVNNNTAIFIYEAPSPTTLSGIQLLSFNIPPNTTTFTVFSGTFIPSTYTNLILIYSTQIITGINTLYWNAFSLTGMGSVVKNLITPTTALDGANKAYVDAAIASANILPLNNTFTGTNTFNNTVTMGSGYTTNVNGAIKTVNNSMQYNSSLDANSYFVVGVAPTTYIFSTNWIINPVSGTTATISLDSALFYFSTSIKYVITFTGIYGTSASWTGTVFNNTTSTTVSDAPITITTTSQTLSMTFTPGSNNPVIYLRFDGASGTLRWTNFTISQADTEVMGNLIIDSQINSNIVQANGKTTNLANGLEVNQTTIATASSLTTASLPAGVSASTLSGTYTLTATAGGSTFGMWLGSSFTYTAGAKYTYTFTGFSTNATAFQAMLLYTNTYSGGAGTMIGDYVVNVPITSSTVSGSFTATSNNNVVWVFVSSAAGKSVSFSGFTLTRADTEITGVITVSGLATDTPTTTIGLNSSNQLIKFTGLSGSVSAGYVPYASSANVLANSIIFQSGSNIGIGVTDPFQKLQVAGRGCFGYIAGSKRGIFIDNEDAYGTIPCIQGVDSAFGTSAIVINPAGGNVGVGEFTPVANFQVRGTASICGGNNYANTNNYMASGSLTIGATNKNYGGGTSYWSGNTAGLMMECTDNTEIAVHDAGNNVSSFMYYLGGAFTIGRDMGWGASKVITSSLLGVRRDPSYALDVNGNQRVYNQSNANDSTTLYGPNATWGAYLFVGAGGDRSGASTAQVMSTNGNLHLDAGNYNSMYYGYHPYSRGAPNQHLFYGSDIQFSTGLPQNTSPYSQVVVMDGNGLRRTQCVINQIYNSQSVAWGGGVNITYAFYNYNSTVAVCLQGRYSGYWTGSYTAQMFVRIYNQNSGNYYTFTHNTFTNNAYNHVTVPLNCFIGNTGSGWNDVYVYSSGYSTDGNDQLQITVLTLPVNAY